MYCVVYVVHYRAWVRIAQGNCLMKHLQTISQLPAPAALPLDQLTNMKVDLVNQKSQKLNNF